MRAARPIGKARIWARSRAGSVTLWLLMVCCCALDPDPWPKAQGQATQDPLKLHYEAARNLLQSGDPERAAAEYKTFLGEAIHRVANAKARTGDLAGAAQLFAEALALAGTDAPMLLDYASVLFDDGRLKEARSITQSVVDREPKNARARVLAGRILFEQKDYPAAKTQFEAAVAGGEFNEVWRLLSITYLRLQELDHARSLLRKMIAVRGGTAQNQVAAAMAYYYGDYPDQAIGELKEVLARDSAAPDAHYDLGLAYLAHNEEAGYLQAISEFHLQLKSNPDDFPSHYMLGYIALQQRNFDEAQRELVRAAALNPQDAGTKLLLGQLYSETHRDQQAEQVLRKLIASSDESQPSNELVRAHYMLGRVLQASGRLDDGAIEIKKSEQLRRSMRMSAAEVSGSRLQSPAGASSKSIEGLYRRPGKFRKSEKEEAQAQAFIRQISPAIAEGYYNLGGIAARRKDSVTAALYLQKAVEWDPALAPRNP